MCRVTFGITCLPFLASKVLLQIAEDHSQQYPEAAAVIRNTFYVDDCLTGASTLEEADSLWQDLNSLLSLGRFTLRKWCSSSAELLQCIPAELQEADCSDLAVSSSQCPKTLGVHWNTHSDMLYVCILTSLIYRFPLREKCRQLWANSLTFWDGSLPPLCT